MILMTTGDLTQIYTDKLAQLKSRFPFMSSLRDEALNNFSLLGLPTKKTDSWKYSRVENRLPDSINLEKGDLEVSLPPEVYIMPGAERIVLVDGVLNPGLSDFSDTLDYQIQTEGEFSAVDLKLDPKDLFDNYSAVIAPAIHTLTFKKKTTRAAPIQIIHLTTGGRNTSSTRIKITAQERSQASVIETFYGFTNSTEVACTTIDVEKEALLNHIKVQKSGEEFNHIGKLSSTIHRDAVFHTFTLSLGGGLVRNHIKVDMVEQGADAHVHGLYALKNEEKSDNFSEIHHNSSQTTSSQLFKGILGDKSRGVFTGKVFIHRDAQQVSANQLNKNLLLSNQARIDTRPQLEVYADDVKCAHGATIGQLSQEEIFYLESRGIPKDQAYEMLMHAFSEDALMKVRDGEIKKYLSHLLNSQFEGTSLETNK